MTVAHVFWHGEITDYERASMLSMLSSGFDVWFWSFQKYDLPAGVRAMDASEIAPISLMLDNIHEHWNSEWGKATSATAATLYSDILRYRLLEMFGGWWFDLDVFCLKPSWEFDALSSSRGICVGGQEPGEELCNNAVLNISDKKIAKDINELVDSIIRDKTLFFWGELGPKLLSDYVKNHGLVDQVLPRELFYPNSFAPNNENIWKYDSDLTEADREEIDLEFSSAYTMHWYNNNLILEDKQVALPPVTSVMGRLFKTVGLDADI